MIEAATTRMSGNKIQFNKDQQITGNGALVDIRRETLKLQLTKRMDLEKTNGENVQKIRMDVELKEIKKDMNEMRISVMKCREWLNESKQVKEKGKPEKNI